MPTRTDWPRTKTWLPENDRLGPSRSRRRGYLPAALLFALLAVGGLYLSVLQPSGGSGDDPRTGAGSESDGTGTTGAAGGESGGSGGSGGAGGSGAAIAGVASRVVAGVPVGYPHTKAGAQAAAANYLVAYGSEQMFGTDGRNRIVTVIAGKGDRAALADLLKESFDRAGRAYGLDAEGTPGPGLDFVARTVPVGVKLGAYSSKRAIVDVWAVSIVGVAGPGSSTPISEAWNTATITLRWADGDWKWDGLTQRDGPTPVSGLQPPSPAAQLAGAVREFEELRHGR